MLKIKSPVCATDSLFPPVFLLVVLGSSCSGPQREGPAASMTLASALAAGDSEGYEQADVVREITFPDDHGSHPGFKTEWWYFTGNVKTVTGREFGYQFTIFRYAIRPGDITATGTTAVTTENGTNDASNWNTSQVYMAHAALSDIKTGKFYYDEQFSRGALGMAGATSMPFRVWLDQWSASGRENLCQDCFALEVTVAAREFQLHMQLNNTQPAVLHGRQGLSVKSPVSGKASYYYSYTRLQTTGRLLLNDNSSYPVTGDSWFDHEWSSSALARDQQGWDWFALQLSDRSEIMLYRLRNDNDPAQDFYYGSLIQDGAVQQTLAGKDINIHTLKSWHSPVSAIHYPAAWTIELPKHRLTVTPKMPDQEVNNSIRYWEGAVAVRGTSGDGTVTGQGYVELTGY